MSHPKRDIEEDLFASPRPTFPPWYIRYAVALKQIQE